MKSIKISLFFMSICLLLALGSCYDPFIMDESERIPELKSTLLKAVPLTPEEIDGILYMREEEKLAHDVYVKLYDLYGHNIFLNISESEQTHMNAMLGLIDFYGLEDSASDELGVFNNEELKQLYTDLMDMATNYVAALEVGVIIEETDIIDINELIDATEVKNLLQVYGHLVSGSENHLRSFTKELEKFEKKTSK